MPFMKWLAVKRSPRPEPRVTIDVAQKGNRLTVRGEGIDLHYSVEGVRLPPDADASFAVWGVMPWAMEEGLDLHLRQPIDPAVAANAEQLSQIWEMWLPERYRSINVTSEGEWSRPARNRLPTVQLVSGGIDSVFSILDRKEQGVKHVATVSGFDKVNDANFDALIAKTDPILEALNCRRFIIRTDAKRDPSEFTHGFTLASCLFLLGDLFEEGALAADWSHAADFAVHPWGSNHVTNALFAGSDFRVRTIGAEFGRTEKIAAIVDAGVDLRHLSFCRRRKSVPENCGTCRKCIRTKAMFLVVTGAVPPIFRDNAFDESMMQSLIDLRNERVELFDLYFYAREHGLLDRLPSLERLIETLRNEQPAATVRPLGVARGKAIGSTPDAVPGRAPAARPVSKRGETLEFDVIQDGNNVAIEAEGTAFHFSVEGISMPAQADRSFAVWALLPMAMEEGFDLRFRHPIDSAVAANAERLSQMWEMWLPTRYQSIRVSGQGEWSRPQRDRLPQVQLFSGGVDSTHAILINRNAEDPGFVATVSGVDKVKDVHIGPLVAKTDPLLAALGYRRIVIHTDAKRQPNRLTHGFTLASSLFLLSDLFERGTIAADWTQATGLTVHPWGNNYIANACFAGTDFFVQTIGSEVGRTAKIAAIVEAGLDPHSLTFCRERKLIPANCGVCPKCIRTKAMFQAVTGRIPDIFVDMSFDGSLLRRLVGQRSERVQLFDLYFYAKKHGTLGRIPSLAALIDECRRRPPDSFD